MGPPATLPPSSLKNDNFLYLVLPGQPVYQLIPSKAAGFRMRGFADYIVEFVVEKGSVTSLKQRDPSGEYEFTKK